MKNQNQKQNQNQNQNKEAKGGFVGAEAAATAALLGLAAFAKSRSRKGSKKMGGESAAFPFIDNDAGAGPCLQGGARKGSAKGPKKGSKKRGGAEDAMADLTNALAHQASESANAANLTQADLMPGKEEEFIGMMDVMDGGAKKRSRKPHKSPKMKKMSKVKGGEGVSMTAAEDMVAKSLEAANNMTSAGEEFLGGGKRRTRKSSPKSSPKRKAGKKRGGSDAVFQDYAAQIKNLTDGIRSLQIRNFI